MGVDDEKAETEQNSKEKETEFDVSRLTIGKVTKLTQIDHSLVDIAVCDSAYAGITTFGALIVWGDYSKIYSTESEQEKEEKAKAKGKGKKKKKSKKEKEKVEEEVKSVEPYLVVTMRNDNDDAEEAETVAINYKRVVSGLSCFVVLHANGRLFSFGADEKGALGLGAEVRKCLQPKAIEFTTDSDSVEMNETQIRDISSWDHGCLADDDKTKERIEAAAEPENAVDANAETEVKTHAFYMPNRISIATDSQPHTIKKAVVTNAGGFFWG